MSKNLIITIGREFCSGGADIGKAVALYFGIPYYDKRIIDETAAALGCATDIIAHYDEKPAKMWGIYGYQYGASWYAGDPSLIFPPGLKIAAAQFAALAKLARGSDCVIVGRCGDHVLKDLENVVRVFVRAELGFRVSRAEELFSLNETEAKKLIRKTDKVRANYYAIHTQKKWGDAKNYDIVINTSKVGVGGAAAAVIKYSESFRQ